MVLVNTRTKIYIVEILGCFDKDMFQVLRPSKLSDVITECSLFDKDTNERLLRLQRIGLGIKEG